MKPYNVILLGLYLLLAGCHNQSAAPVQTPAASLPSPEAAAPPDSSPAAPEPNSSPAAPEPNSSPAAPEPDSSPAAPDSVTGKIARLPQIEIERIKTAVQTAKQTCCRYPTIEIPLSRVDFTSYEDELSAEDRQTLASFFPVLTEGKPFLGSQLPGFGEPPVSPEALRIHELFSSYGFEDPPAEFTLSSFALCDITGDGRKELALYSSFQVGLNCVLHKEGDAFYGVYMPVRWFLELQENGVFSGSGGAASSYYQRLHFEDGLPRVELLGQTDWDYYAIGGQEVKEDTFEAWREELLPGEVPWHIARAVDN